MAKKTQKSISGSSKFNEFNLVTQYPLGYRHREDVTNLPAGVLIVGSQNVLTNVSERVQIRQGYSVDGSESSVNASIKSSTEWMTRGNSERLLRAGFLTSAGNDGKLQYRYENSSGVVSWRDLLTGLSSVSYNFTPFWSIEESLRVILFVKGESEIQEWNGAITTFASATSNTLTKQGTDTWLDTGFYSKTFSTVGSSSTQFDITNPSGTTFRYTWDGTGTTPSISSSTFPVGSYVLISAQNFNAANNGIFLVTAVGTDYFEVTNASGVVESNKTIGSGFIYNKYTKVLKIGSGTYAYTGGETTTTLTGVIPDPSLGGFSAGDVIHQAVITTNNTAMTGITATFKNGLIKVMNNQIFLGSLTSSVMWLSKVNYYTDYSSSTTRQSGEGGSLILDSNLVAFNVQGAQDNPSMYVSAGRDTWYKITFTDYVSVVGASGQTIGAVPIKSGVSQGAKSQAFVSNMKNNTITVTNEPTVDLIGVMENYFTQIQTKNISDTIKLDMDSYDFEDGSIYYWRFYILVAVPRENIVLIFNVATGSWEAPQTLPITQFYTVNGELYGHSYTSSESYKLFTGYADRVYPGFAGYPIKAVWKFSYQNYGSRYAYKKANMLYIEGYINPNTTLNAYITYELDGCSTTKNFKVVGTDSQIVCLQGASGSFGVNSFGEKKLGGDSSDTIDNLPPKFRVEKSFSSTNFFESSISFEVLGTDQRMELLVFGLNATPASEEPIIIRQ